MKERGLILETAAKAVDHDKSWLSSILTGSKNITLRAFLELCQKNGLAPAALFSEDEETARLLDSWSRLDEAGRRQALAVLEALVKTSTEAHASAGHPPATPKSPKRAG